MSIRRDIADTPVSPDLEVLIPRTGSWATVNQVIGATVSVTVEDYDGGEHYFGPVPFLPSDAPPLVDDRVFLHFDDQGRAAYAATFT